jgi:hypothetical protein
MKFSDRITFDPDQCGGGPCIRGMRVRVKDILDMLAGGASEQEILAETNRALLAWFIPLLPAIVVRIQAGDRPIEIR